jgi:hypothetical protein
MTRPEGAMFFALVSLFRLLTNLRRERRLLPRKFELAWLGLFLGLFLPYFAWRWHYYGWPFPNTFYVKSSGASGTWKLGAYYLRRFSEDYGVHFLILLAVFGRAARDDARRRDLRLLTALVWLAFAAYVVKVGGDFMGLYRFILPVIPLGAVVLAESVSPHLRAVLLPRLGAFVPGLALVAVGAGFVAGSAQTSRQALTYVGADNGIDMPVYLKTYAEERIPVGQWLGKHKQPDDLMTVGGAGVIPYYSEIPAYDIFGLVDATIAHDPRMTASTDRATRNGAVTTTCSHASRRSSPTGTASVAPVPSTTAGHPQATNGCGQPPRCRGRCAEGIDEGGPPVDAAIELHEKGQEAGFVSAVLGEQAIVDQAPCLQVVLAGDSFVKLFTPLLARDAKKLIEGPEAISLDGRHQPGLISRGVLAEGQRFADHHAAPKQHGEALVGPRGQAREEMARDLVEPLVLQRRLHALDRLVATVSGNGNLLPARDALGPGTRSIGAKTRRQDRQIILLIGKQIERQPGRAPELDRQLRKQQPVRLERRIHVRPQRRSVRRFQIALYGVILRLADRRSRPPILGSVCREGLRAEQSAKNRDQNTRWPQVLHQSLSHNDGLPTIERILRRMSRANRAMSRRLLTSPPPGTRLEAVSGVAHKLLGDLS